MGWWSLDTVKKDSKGNDVELNDDDLNHIAELIKEGYTSGEIVNEE
jgi:hypothetical protein